MTLYEIDNALNELIDPETGELKDYEAFVALNMERDKKIENTACWLKDMLGDAEKIKKEIDALIARKKTIEARAARIREYITQALDGEKFASPRCNISYRKSTALEVSDSYAAARWLEDNGFDDLVTYEEPKISKVEVKKLIATNDLTIPGTAISEKTSTIIK